MCTPGVALLHNAQIESRNMTRLLRLCATRLQFLHKPRRFVGNAPTSFRFSAAPSPSAFQLRMPRGESLTPLVAASVALCGSPLLSAFSAAVAGEMNRLTSRDSPHPYRVEVRIARHSVEQSCSSRARCRPVQPARVTLPSNSRMSTANTRARPVARGLHGLAVRHLDQHSRKRADLRPAQLRGQITDVKLLAGGNVPPRAQIILQPRVVARPVVGPPAARMAAFPIPTDVGFDVRACWARSGAATPECPRVVSRKAGRMGKTCRR